MRYLNKVFFLLCFLCITYSYAQVQTIRNGVVWRDTDGHRIQAHSGGIYHYNNKFYLLGLDRSENFDYKRLNLYVSDDLMNWKFLNTIIDENSFSEEYDPNTPAEKGKFIIARSHMIYNEKTEKFLIWSKFRNRKKNIGKVAIFSSSTIDGKYEFEKAFLPEGHDSNDCNIFKDDDGKLYFVSNDKGFNTPNDPSDDDAINIYEATDDYFGIKRKVISLFPKKHREAPVLFKKEGVYYLLTSFKSGWRPNKGQYASSTSLESGWSDGKRLGNDNTYDTQPTGVFSIKDEAGNASFYYLGDRHKDPNMAESKNILLPMTVNDGHVTLEYVPEYTIDLKTGAWTPQDSDTYVPQDNWSLVSVSSQKNSSGQDAAVSAFDGDLSTRWLTASNAEPPHELVINLGDDYDVSGFFCVPRQDNSVKGFVRDFQLYLSTDGENWGAPVAAGWLGYNTMVSFKKSQVAHYVKFVGITSADIGGGTRPYASSISELKLLTTTHGYKEGGVNVNYDINGNFFENKNSAEVNQGDKLKFWAKGYSLNEAPSNQYGSFSWYGPNGFYAKSRKASLTITGANQLGDYTVYFLDDSFSVQKKTFTVTSTTLAVNDETFDQNIILYPNPAKGKTVHILNGFSDTPYVVYDIMGKEVSRGKGKNIDVSQLQLGCYFVNIEGKTYRVIKK